MKSGKSCGVDVIAAEHIFTRQQMYTCTFIYFIHIFCISWTFPINFMKSALVPIIKNKTRDTNDKNNYRLIALVTAMSKLFEFCLSEKNCMYISSYQFGFKADV